MKKIFIAGGAGFIGSNLTKYILKHYKDAKVVIYDNFSSGKMKHFEKVLNKNVKIINGDIKNLKKLLKYTKGTDTIFHLAANPDIAKAVEEPTIDFWEGTYLTNNILEAIRINKIKTLIYSSGSGVYGENKKINFNEDYGPCIPISTYGASKLGCEAMIASYSFMYNFKAIILRFANVVGPFQTHGVGYDFLRKLKNNSKKIKVLGNGKQSKSYIHVEDIIVAMFMVYKKIIKSNKNYDYYNIATGDYITVKEILEICLKLKNIKKNSIKIVYDRESRGWAGDVPIVRFNIKKIKKINWKPKYNSKQAIENSLNAMIRNDS